MTDNVALGVALILLLGVGAQWIAWRLHTPAILFLLAVGILAGPVTGLIDPDLLFGDGLTGLVKVSVALILFEGGLSLHLSEIHQLKRTLTRLVTLGAVVSWLATAFFAEWMFGLGIGVSLLLGATLVVTGPTVIVPLLRHVRPTAKPSALLKWEGIVIDPIGATLALLVFEVLVATGSQAPVMIAIKGIVLTILVGVAFGSLGAFLIYWLLRRYWTPDYLQIPIILATVVGLFAASELIQHESGFLTVTVMGMLLGNQRKIAMGHIVEFKENLRTLLIASLFILLSARLDLGPMRDLGWPVLGFIALMIVIVRPLSVFLSTIGSTLTRNEKLFVCFVAPRGVVAAAVSSVFALGLEAQGYDSAKSFVSVVFAVIIGTVLFYGLGAAPIAKLLGVGGPNPQGVLFIGAHDWARKIALKLQESGFRVLLADTNRENIRNARLEGLDAWYGNALSESSLEEMDLNGIGRVLAMTSNGEINKLASQQFREIFSRSEAYRLAGAKGPTSQRKTDHGKTHDERGRIVFDKDMNFGYFTRRFLTGADVRITKLTDTFDYEAFKEKTLGTARLLFVIRKEGELLINTKENPLETRPGDTIITLADREEAVSAPTTSA